MATNGRVDSSTAGSGGKSYLYVTWNRTDIWNSGTCGSYIDWHLYLHNGNRWYSNAIKCYQIYIDGTEVYSGGTWSNYTSDGDYELASGSTSVQHNDDGTKSFNINFTGWFYSATNVSGSKDFTLDTIGRYPTGASISVVSKSPNSVTIDWSVNESCSQIQYKIGSGSWIDVEGSGTSGRYTIYGLSPNTTYTIYGDFKRADSGLWSSWASTEPSVTVATFDIGKLTVAPNFNDEENPTITYSNPAGNTVTSLQACIASPNGQVIHVGYRDISKTGTSYTFNLTTAERTTLRKACTNSPELNVKFYVTTVSGGSTYYSTLDKTMTIKDGKPIFSNFTVEEVDDGVYNLTQNRQKFIRKYSDIKVTIPSGDKMVAQKEATAKSYNVIAGDQNKLLTYSTDDLTTTISNMDSNKVEVYAVDSRNNQTPVSKSLDIIDYKEVVLNSIKFERKNGVEETILITGNGTWTNVNFGAVVNSIKSFVFRRKNKKESIWSDWYSIKELFHINENGTFNNKVENEFTAVTFNFGEEYDVEVKLEDELSTLVRPASVNSGKILMSALKEYGVCFGGVYDKNLGGALQVKGKNLEKLAAGVTIVANTEIATNEYIDGKMVYIKQLEFTDGINGSEQFTKAHGITGASKIWIDTANSYFINDVNRSIPVPCNMFENNFNDRIGIEVTSTSINIFTDTTWWDWWTKVIRLKYIK